MHKGPGARRRFVVIGSLVAGLLIIAVFGVILGARRVDSTGSAKRKSENTAAPPAAVELSEVRRGSISTFLETTATLEARNSAILVAQRSGQVVAILVEDGKWVKRGDARLSVQRTELGAEMAKREIERGNQLGDKGYLSKKELDDLNVRMRNAWVESEQARYDLSQTRLRAPFAGRVVERMVNLGETVTEGKECFRIVDFNPVLLRLFFPERELNRVRVGQEATVTLNSHPRPFAARVSLVNPVVDPTNGTFKVTLEIPNPSGLLRPGAFAHVRLKTGHVGNAVLVARRSVLSEDGEQYVFVARGDSVVKVAVRVGVVESDTAEVVEGLAPGEKVVTVGQGGLKPGAKIKAVAI
jgi:membrane fusion protein (multidrug efflux system)